MAFPQNPNDLEVGVAYGANLSSPLTTLTYDILTPEYVKAQMVITRGRIGGAARTQPTTVEFGLRNPGGIFSPRNIAGPNYGRLRRNTPVRVRLDPGTGMVTRAIGYLPDWPVRWTGPGIDDRIPMQAAGALRRLGTGKDAKSALRRTIGASAPAAYWPVEDDRDSATLASAIPGGPPAIVRGGVALGSNGVLGTTGLAGASSVGAAVTPDAASAGAPTVGNLVLPLTGGNVLTFWVQGTPWESPPAGGVQTTVIHRLSFAGSSGGATNTISYADIYMHGYDPAGGYTSTVGYRVRFYFTSGSASGTDIYTGTLQPTWTPFDGRWHEVQLALAQNGTSIDANLYVDGALGGSWTTTFKTLTPFSQLVAGFTGSYQDSVNAFVAPYRAPYSIGHVSAHNAFGGPASSSFYVAGLAYAGEWAQTRFVRLCQEEGIATDAVAGPVSEALGWQLPGNVVDLLRECEDSDEAVIVERRTGVLGFDRRISRYNLPVSMTLDYEAGHTPTFTPEDDDRDLVNYVTVNRTGGSSATYERVTGPLGTDPVTGVGRYPDAPTRNLASDDQTLRHAAWLSNEGTVDEPRYVIGVDLAAHPELVTQWLACDIGSRIQVIHPPAIQVGPAPADLVIEGYQEFLDAAEWYVTIYAMPYRPYEVFQIESGTGNRSRIPAGVSTLNVGYAADATSLSVTSAVTRWIDSATYAAKFPIVIEIAGEVMTCTAITGTGLTQTFTVQRGLHGVSKPLPINSAVQIWRPPVIGL